MSWWIAFLLKRKFRRQLCISMINMSKVGLSKTGSTSSLRLTALRNCFSIRSQRLLMTSIMKRKTNYRIKLMYSARSSELLKEIDRQSSRPPKLIVLTMNSSWKNSTKCILVTATKWTTVTSAKMCLRFQFYRSISWTSAHLVGTKNHKDATKSHLLRRDNTNINHWPKLAIMTQKERRS